MPRSYNYLIAVRLINYREFANLTANSRCVNLKYVNTVRNRKIIFRQHIPIGGAVAEGTVVLQFNNKFSVYRENPDRALTRK